MDNKGFSLIEMIVTLLASSLVLLSLMGFISVTSRSYTATSAEVALQMEAQIASNLIADLLVEAKELEQSVIGMDGLLLIRAAGGSEGDIWYAILQDAAEKQLLFLNCGGTKPGDVTMLAADMKTNRSKTFLARFVSYMMVTQETKQLVRLQLELTYSGKAYQSNTSVLLRNENIGAG